MNICRLSGDIKNGPANNIRVCLSVGIILKDIGNIAFVCMHAVICYSQPTRTMVRHFTIYYYYSAQSRGVQLAKMTLVRFLVWFCKITCVLVFWFLFCTVCCLMCMHSTKCFPVYCCYHTDSPEVDWCSFYYPIAEGWVEAKHEIKVAKPAETPNSLPLNMWCRRVFISKGLKLSSWSEASSPIATAAYSLTLVTV